MSEQVDQREYFISYNSADAANARALSTALEAAGISHHFDAGGLDAERLGFNSVIWSLTMSANAVDVAS